MRYSALTALAGLGALAGCATVPAPSVAARVVVVPSKQLEISAVRVQDNVSSVLVRGRVARRTIMPGAIWGHLHIEAWRGGERVTWADARWSTLSRHRLPTSGFGAMLAVPPAQIDEIRISHVATAHRRACQAGACS